MKTAIKKGRVLVILVAAACLAQTGCIETIGNGKLDTPLGSISTDTIAAGADMLRPGTGSAIRKGEAALQKVTGHAQADSLGGFDYATTYQVIQADGTKIDVPADAQIVAIDTPIAPKLPAPRVRTLHVGDIAPKIAVADAVQAAHSNVVDILSGTDPLDAALER